MATKRAISGAAKTTASGSSIITDELEIRRQLRRAAEARTVITLKVRGSDTVLRGRMIDVDPRSEGVQMMLDIPEVTAEDGSTPDLLEKSFQEQNTRECMVLIHLQGRSIIGINAEPTEVEGRRVVFNYPSKVFKIQRRRSVRYKIPEAYEFTLEFQSPESGVRVKKRIIDISEHGVSFFILSPREAGFFRSGMIIKHCTIHVQHQNIEVMLKMVNATEYDRGEKGRGNKIGAAFEQIKPGDQSYLSQLVYSHTQHLSY
jgi:hypothetical protein